MIKSRFTLKQLEALVFVVDTGTFRRAAAALGTTQPNISARIAALEDTLGQVLLFRDAGSVRVSAQGAKVLAQARRILREGEALLEIAERTDLIDEQLRLGVTELIACTSLHPFLRRVSSAYPNLKVHLEVNLATEILRKLSAREIDLALVSGPVPEDDASFTPLFECGYVWVAEPGLAARIGPEAPLADLVSEVALTHARNTQAVAALEQVCQARGIPLDNIVHSSSLAACVPMALDGMGVALLPHDMVRGDLDAGRLAPIACDWMPPPLTFFAGFQRDRASKYVAHTARLAQEVFGVAAVDAVAG